MSHPNYAVPCPTCSAEVSKPCRTAGGHTIEPEKAHKARKVAAGVDVPVMGRKPLSANGKGTTVYVPGDLLGAVLARAEREGLSQSKAIRAALTAWSSEG